jgi:methylenetetrahydrofolate--tRNA-(uracil-5-)-methyltransferase
MGALLHYIVSADSADRFQPMNINFGLLNSSPAKKIKKKERNSFLTSQALQSLTDWIVHQNLNE